MKVLTLHICQILWFISIIHTTVVYAENVAKNNDLLQYKERRLALVIGNSNYMQGPLRNPDSDSTAVAQTLKSLGFDVIFKQNLDRKSFRQAIRNFGDRLFNYDVSVFYYAGHGLQVEGVNYLIPIDAEIRVENEVQDESIEAAFVLRKVKSAGNLTNIVILDACRNNPFARSFRSSKFGLARMHAPLGTLIAYSTAPGSIAADGHGINSPYTKHLLKNMVIPGVPVEKVFKQVRIGLSMETKGKQISWEASSLMGDFYFSRSVTNEKKIYGMLEIKVYDIEGDVFVDDSKITYSKNDKTAFVTLSPGWHSVVIKKDEHEFKTQKVFVTAGNVSYVNWVKEWPVSADRQKVIKIKPKKHHFLPPP